MTQTAFDAWLYGSQQPLVKHIIALSGGKDSTAMAIRLHELYPDINYIPVCTPTGNEPPEMFAHWQKIGKLLGTPIIPIIGGTLVGKIREQNALPNWRQRWCTRMLKIEPYAAWLMKQGDCISYVGLRADEPDREGGDYLDVPGVRMCFPMREWDWNENDVWEYLSSKNIIIPKRTDCTLCFYQRLIEWFELWRDNKAAWNLGKELEQLTGHTFRSDGRDSWPASLTELELAFEWGAIPRETRRDTIADMKCRVCRI